MTFTIFTTVTNVTRARAFCMQHKVTSLRFEPCNFGVLFENFICVPSQTAPPPFIKDWYGLYKQRVKMDSPAKVMVVDLGSFSCKCAVVDRVKSRVKTVTIESVVALVSRRTYIDTRESVVGKGRKHVACS